MLYMHYSNIFMYEKCAFLLVLVMLFDKFSCEMNQIITYISKTAFGLNIIIVISNKIFD